MLSFSLSAVTAGKAASCIPDQTHADIVIFQTAALCSPCDNGAIRSSESIADKVTLKMQRFAVTTSIALKPFASLLLDGVALCAHSIILHYDKLQCAPAQRASALLAADKDLQGLLTPGRQKIRKDLRLPKSLKTEYGTLGTSPLNRAHCDRKSVLRAQLHAELDTKLYMCMHTVWV